MKEDILEQLVEDWLQAQGYFTRANLRFKPAKTHPEFDSKKDSVPSDIDVIGIHPGKEGPERIMVVGCKAWQVGFGIGGMRDALVTTPDEKVGNKQAWQHFRELVKPKWTEAFLREVENATGSRVFTYVTAITVSYDLVNRSKWENEPIFRKAMLNNPIQIVTLQDMVDVILRTLSTAMESSQLGRTLQLLKAAGMDMGFKNNET